MALLSTPAGMNKAEIFRNVRGYRETFSSQGSSEALEKVFERDKDTIRSVGFPLTDNGAENPADIRYFIRPDEYGMDNFSSTEVNILNNASAIWHQSSLSDDARASARRIAALDVPASGEFLGYAPRVTTHDPAFPVLTDLIEQGKAASFLYLKPGSTRAEPRQVSGLGLVQFEGHWMLHGYDHDRGATRNFLLQRMVSLPAAAGPLRVDVHHDQISVALRELHELWDKTKAVVNVAPGSEAEIVLRNRRGTDHDEDGNLVVHYVDESIFADELCAFGDETVVLSPRTLRDAVIERLTILEAQHG
jgi:proteasome accessory factor B